LPAPGNAASVPGDYRIQLAAVRAEADARRAWDLFLVDLGPVLSGQKPIFERAETANGVFYRVQVGPFGTQEEAEILCDELKRRNASCFVLRR
jgi:cell division septation protein DedD